jgi:hypothetical protein
MNLHETTNSKGKIFMFGGCNQHKGACYNNLQVIDLDKENISDI